MKFKYIRIMVNSNMDMFINGEPIDVSEYIDMINDGWEVVLSNYITYNSYMILEKEV